MSKPDKKTFLKKLIRKIQINDFKFKPVQSIQLKGLINYFIRDHGDSWKHVYIFSEEDVETVEATLREAGFAVDGTINWSDCPGRPFHNPARFFVQKGRVFVTQWGGLDV